MKKLTFEVSVEEANLILEGLGNLPFSRVFALVNKLQQQAGSQLNEGEPNGAENSQTDQNILKQP